MRSRASRSGRSRPTPATGPNWPSTFPTTSGRPCRSRRANVPGWVTATPGERCFAERARARARAWPTSLSSIRASTPRTSPQAARYFPSTTQSSSTKPISSKTLSPTRSVPTCTVGGSGGSQPRCRGYAVGARRLTRCDSKPTGSTRWSPSWPQMLRPVCRRTKVRWPRRSWPRGSVVDAARVLREHKIEPGSPAASRKARASKAAQTLDADLGAMLDPQIAETHVAFVEREHDRDTLLCSPVDVDSILAGTLFPNATVVATSATLAVGGRFDDAARRLGLAAEPEPQWTGLRVDSPFDFKTQAILYVPKHLPEPNDPAYRDAMATELHELITAAGGRTLALFTSWAAMRETADRCAALGGYDVLRQGDAPRRQLVDRLKTTADTGGVAVFATMGFWTGVDVAGVGLTLVTIDRIPFPRPNEPLHAARRQRAAAARDGSVRGSRPPARRDPTGAGHRPPRAVADRSRGRGGARPAPGHRALPDAPPRDDGAVPPFGRRRRSARVPARGHCGAPSAIVRSSAGIDPARPYPRARRAGW